MQSRIACHSKFFDSFLGGRFPYNALVRPEESSTDIWGPGGGAEQASEGLLETLDDIVRYGAVSLMLWLAVLAVRDFRDRVAGWLGALTSIASAAYLLASKPGLALFGVDIDIVLLPLHVGLVGFAWLFCLSQFDDYFTVARWQIAVVALKMLSGGAFHIAEAYGKAPDIAPYLAFSPLIVTGIVLHLIYVVWQGRNDDLVESRRRSRAVFVTGTIVISVGVMMVELFLTGIGIKDELRLLQASVFFGMAVYPLWRISAPDGEDLFFRAHPPATAAASDAHCELSATDRADLDTIVAISGTDFILEPGLTISRLAAHAGVPEHRLRHLINQHMGYRNFADYLNHHRVEAAKTRLAERDERHTPVLTVAMDLGYGSLGPFNRAFKERTGLTPTEFRSRSLEAGAAGAK